MKKILLLLGCLFLLGGCMEIEDIPGLWPSDDQVYVNWKFPSIDKQAEDLVINLLNRNHFDSNTDYYAAPGSTNKSLVVAIYNSSSAACEEHAKYLEELADRYQNSSVEFIIIFIDNKLDNVLQQKWVKDIRQVRVYYNGNNFYEHIQLTLGIPQVFFIQDDHLLNYFIEGYSDNPQGEWRKAMERTLGTFAKSAD